ncbi:MAG TPA: 3-hydroxyacyl-CoA dehydrogenase family protein [Puia sp.]|nr:3-hydroxyacyl-CoA dehydrogenase family protein [Puia sp.]
MKVLVLTSPDAKPAIQEKLKLAGEGLIFVDSPGDFFDQPNADAYFDLGFQPDKKRIDLLSGLLPKPVFVDGVSNTLHEIRQPFIRICGWPTLLEKEICEIVVNDPAIRLAAEKFLLEMQWKYQVLPDTVGMVSARIIAMIVNEAYFTRQEEISSVSDIDTAMKLGTNYPFGPFEWADKIGLKKIYKLLKTLNSLNPDYEVSALLADEASKSER